MKRLLRTIETLAHLRPSQVAARLWFKTYRPRADRRAGPQRRLKLGSWVSGPPRQPSLLAVDRVRFLNIEVDIDSAEIWQDRSRGDLWRYNLHYFDDLVAEGAVDRHHWHTQLIERWISENPPGIGAGWEPYTLSLRIVNWIKWDITTGRLSPRAIDNLAVQVRYLRQRLEYHILGNHLLANAKAVYFAGLFFADDEGNCWLQFGRELLASQVKEQILADGGHFELSPMYHLIVAEDILDCLNASAVFHTSLPEDVVSAAARMVAWAGNMQHPDQEIPFFNDASFAISPEPQEVVDYATRLGLAPSPTPTIETTLANSGYARIDADVARLFVDAAAVGPRYQPGHAHADSLSFELSIRGRRLFVNSGTSIYGTSAERHRQRSTSAHNCVVIDGQNSSDVWAGFRVAQRANIVSQQLSQERESTYIAASHDGYRRLKGRPIHSRSWLLKNSFLRVEDKIAGTGRHTVDIFLHLHPEVAPERRENELFITMPNGGEVTLSSDLPFCIEHTTWHPGFGVSFDSKMLHAQLSVDLPWSGSFDVTW